MPVWRKRQPIATSGRTTVTVPPAPPPRPLIVATASLLEFGLGLGLAIASANHYVQPTPFSPPARPVPPVARTENAPPHPGAVLTQRGGPFQPAALPQLPHIAVASTPPPPEFPFDGRVFARSGLTAVVPQPQPPPRARMVQTEERHPAPGSASFRFGPPFWVVTGTPWKVPARVVVTENPPPHPGAVLRFAVNPPTLPIGPPLRAVVVRTEERHPHPGSVTVTAYRQDRPPLRKPTIVQTEELPQSRLYAGSVAVASGLPATVAPARGTFARLVVTENMPPHPGAVLQQRVPPWRGVLQIRIVQTEERPPFPGWVFTSRAAPPNWQPARPVVVAQSVPPHHPQPGAVLTFRAPPPFVAAPSLPPRPLLVAQTVPPQHPAPGAVRASSAAPPFVAQPAPPPRPVLVATENAPPHAGLAFASGNRRSPQSAYRVVSLTGNAATTKTLRGTWNPGGQDMADRIDWTCFAGEDTSLPDTIYQVGTTTPQNISGWSVSFVLHAYGDPSTVYVTKSVGSGIALTSPTAGLLTITLSSGDTSGMTAGLYGYRVERTDAGADAVLTVGTVQLEVK